jgi:hypothetical protein
MLSIGLICLDIEQLSSWCELDVAKNSSIERRLYLITGVV